MKLLREFLPVLLFGMLACTPAQTGGGRVDPALAAMVPADTVMLAGVQMESLRATALYRKLATAERLKELDDFAARTSFDPRKDVRELLIASNGADAIVLARGSFHPTAIDGAKKSTYRNWTVLTKGDGAVAILDPGTAVAGNLATVRKALDQRQSGRSGAPALLERVRSLPLTAQIWAVSSGFGRLPEGLTSPDSNLSNLSRIFQTVENTSFTADLRSGLNATANGVCKTEQDAKTLSDALRGIVGLGRLSVPENRPEMLRLYDGVKVDQQQRAIQINVQIPADLIDQFLKMTETAPRGRL